MDSTRARSIVKLAASIAENSYSKEWLTRDERGKWEQTAGEYLQSTAEKATALGLSATTVDTEIATMLALLAAEAQIKSK